MKIAIDCRLSIPKKEMTDILESKGHIVDDNVDETTNVLVQPNDAKRITNKLRQAILNRVEIITEDQLQELLK